MINQKIFFSLTLILFSISIRSQKIITGTIISQEDKLPLLGVTIFVKNSSIATTTDFDGQYSIEVKDERSILVFSYLGYKKKEVLVLDKDKIDITLVPEINNLDEIVVIGYGSVKKADLTGSITTIKTKKLKNINSPTVETLLQGTAAGVKVTSSDGTPGAGMNIRIRGSASVNASSEPLYVIDGFPIVVDDTEIAPSGGGIGASLSPLASINPSDIESIEILKDASSTAIYGARGANGVVLITTKSGKAGKPIVSYDMFTGVSTVSNTLDMMNQEEYLFMLRDVVSGDVYFNPNTGDFYDYLKEPSAFIDWQDKIFRTAYTQNHNVNVNGGSAVSKFNLSVGHFENEGVVIASQFKRTNGRLNFSTKLNEKIDLGAKLTHSSTNYSGSFSGGGEANFGGITYNALRYRPIIPNLIEDYAEDDFTTFDELDALTGNTSNPVAFAEDLKRVFSYNRSRFDFNIDYKFLEDFELRITGGAVFNNNQIKKFYPITTAIGRLYNGRADRQDTNTTTLLNENTLNYSARWNKHTVRGLVGFTLQKYESESLYNRVHDFPISTNGFNDISAGLDPQIPLSINNQWNMASFISRFNYDYKRKYYLTLSYRRDGSSRFGSRNKWAGFPSGAISWNVAREDFLKGVKEISELKLRASYGRTGNQNIASFRSLESLDPVSYPFGDQLAAGVVNGEIGNPDLKWETTDQVDLGLDIGLLDNKISFTADWFRKSTKDLLVSVRLPSTTGFTSALQNIGAIEQSGYEFALNTDFSDNSNDFTWNASFNISFLRNEVTDLGESNEIYIGGGSRFPVNIVRVGEPLGAFYGLVWDGNYQLQHFNYDETLPHENRIYTLKDDVAATVGFGAVQQPGDIKFRDVSGPDGVPDGIVDENDRQIIGNPNPKHFGGFLNNFKYKNIELSIFLNWSYGNDIYNWQRFNFGLPGPTVDQNHLSEVVNFWTIDNQNNQIPRLGQGGKQRTGNFGNSFMIEDGSFLRLTNITLGYNLPDDVLKKLKLNGLRVFISGDNLYTWTNYTGYDPEVSLSRNQLAIGQDKSPYPRATTIRLGLNVKF